MSTDGHGATDRKAEAHPPRSETKAVTDDQSTDRDPVVEAYKKDLDRTLLRANLKLTVTRRFRQAMAHAKFADELLRAGKALRSRPK